MASRKEILNLLAKGKITADEAASMLTADNTAAEKQAFPNLASEIEIEEEFPTHKAQLNQDGPNWFRVRVRNLETGKNKVKVNIPLKMFKFGMRIGRRFAPEMKDLQWDDIDTMVQEMQSGMLVEVEDEDSNEHVQVFLE